MNSSRRLAMVFLVCVTLIGCAGPYVKTDLDSFLENPERYANARVIITTDLESLLADPGQYQDREVEITGFVDYHKSLASNDWGFTLYDKRGNDITCYEYEYRYFPSSSAVMLLMQAQKQNQPITVVGDFKPNAKIETDWIEYQGRVIDTDYIYKPPVLPNFPSGIRRP